MNPYAVLAAAARDWERVAAALETEPDVRDELAVLLRRMRAAEGSERYRAAAVRAARLLLDRFPGEFGQVGVGDAARFTEGGDPRETVQGFTAADLAVLVLDGHRMVGPVLGPVRERLLEAPSLSAETVRRHGGDPDAPGLIRLRGTGGCERLPAFQFSGRGRPWGIVLEVNEMLCADRDPWGAADWWLSQNAWLGVGPAELLGRGRDRELADVAGYLVEED